MIKRERESLKAKAIIHCCCRHYSAVERSRLACSQVRSVERGAVRMVMHQTTGWWVETSLYP